LFARGRGMNAYFFLSEQDVGLFSNFHQKLSQESDAVFEALREDYPRDYALSRCLNFKNVGDLLDARDLLIQLNDRFLLAECDQVLSIVFTEWDERSLFYSEENLALRQEIGDLDGEATAALFLGNLVLCRGDVDRFLNLLQRALACYEAVGNRWGCGKVLQSLAFFYTTRGNYAEALRQSELLLKLSYDLSSHDLLFEYLVRRAYIALTKGEYDRSIRYAEKALELGRNFTAPERIDFTLYLLGRSHFSRGEDQLARSFLRQYFTVDKKWETWGARYRAVQFVGLMAAREGQMRRAAICFGAQDGPGGHQRWLLENLTLPERSEYEQALAAVQAALGDEALAAALEAGRAMTVEQVNQLAFEGATDKV